MPCSRCTAATWRTTTSRRSRRSRAPRPSWSSAWRKDIWETTQAGGPVSIHHGEGTNHYFHGTLHNRACWLPMMLTGNIGKHGAGVFTWAGNYKGALFQASPWSGPGAGAYSHEDPFAPVLDENARSRRSTCARR